MSEKWFVLVAGILAVWRITFLFVMEDGPFDIFHRIRQLAGDSFFGRLLNCFFCLSVWVSTPFGILFGETVFEKLFFIATLSGGACIIERFADREHTPPVTQFFEEDITEE